MYGSSQWYMAIGGHQVGPVTQEEIIANLRNGSIDAETLVFTTGMANWQKVKDVPAFQAFVAGGTGGAVPPPPTAPGRRAHDIDFVIHGNEMQFVEVELDPGEAAIAEAGVMMYMTSGINLETIFGDGSKPSGGVLDALWGAGKRILTGESLFMTVFTNGGQGKHRVAFGAPYPARSSRWTCARSAVTSSARRTRFSAPRAASRSGIAFQRKIGVGLFGGEGFIMQKLEGDGLCFVHAGGTIHHLDLAAGETLRVDTGCLVALQPSVNYDIQFVGKIKTALFGGEGIFFATLQGPGRVWLQSLPLSRMADRIYKAAPQTGGRRSEEGSILDRVGGLGDLIDGR